MKAIGTLVVAVMLGAGPSCAQVELLGVSFAPQLVALARPEPQATLTAPAPARAFARSDQVHLGRTPKNTRDVSKLIERDFGFAGFHTMGNVSDNHGTQVASDTTYQALDAGWAALQAKHPEVAFTGVRK